MPAAAIVKLRSLPFKSNCSIYINFMLIKSQVSNLVCNLILKLLYFSSILKSMTMAF